MSDPAKPPVAPRVPHRTHLHGDERIDPYHWLRYRQDPAVRAYLDAENAWTRRRLAHTEALQQRLFDEMLGRIQEDDSSVPVRRGGYWYYHRTVEGRPYAIHCRREGTMEAPEEVLLDENELAHGYKYFHLYVYRVSPDHQRVAFATDTSGAERYTIRFKDLRTGELLPDRVEDAKWGIRWANDSRSLFYTLSDHADRPHRLMRHQLGDPPHAARCVYDEPDERFSLSIERTRDDRYLVLSSESTVTSEVHVLDADDPGGDFRVIEPRRQDVEYSVDHHEGRFLVLTNDGARGFRLMQAPEATPSREHWTDLVPHCDDVTLTDLDVFERHLVLWEWRDGLPGLRIVDPWTGEGQVVEMPEEVYELEFARNPEVDATRYRFEYASPVTPASVVEIDLATRAWTVLKRQPVLGGFEASSYECHRLWATAPDGERIPISVVHRRGLALNGDNPGLLTGYGSYGDTVPVGFSSRRISLLDRGFVVATAHVRGGGELGRRWYEAGKYLEKKNSFTDFVACAEHLFALGYTRPERLALLGGSAGGLLVGAVVTTHPEICRVAVAQVPFVDTINTMVDETLPLTAGEWEEWGNPRDDPTFYAYIRSYSPYDNVCDQRYPALLVTGGLNDPRVGYWEPAKWVAQMRATCASGDRELLLRTYMGAGHSGRSGRYGRLADVALEYAFILDQLGIGE